MVKSKAKTFKLALLQLNAVSNKAQNIASAKKMVTEAA